MAAARVYAIAATLVAAVASALRGPRYVHSEQAVIEDQTVRRVEPWATATIGASTPSDGPSGTPAATNGSHPRTGRQRTG